MLNVILVRGISWHSSQWIYTKSAVPNLFGTRDWFHGRKIFHGPGVGDGFDMILVHYIYCALYFYYYYIVIYNEIIIQLTIMLTGGGAQAVRRPMGSGCKYRWSFTRSPTAHFLLCSPEVGDPCIKWLNTWMIIQRISKRLSFVIIGMIYFSRAALSNTIAPYCLWLLRHLKYD